MAERLAGDASRGPGGMSRRPFEIVPEEKRLLHQIEHQVAWLGLVGG
jgi:hypothetical protein